MMKKGPYSPEESKALEDMAARGMSNRQMADALNRPIDSIRQRLTTINCMPWKQNHINATPKPPRETLDERAARRAASYRDLTASLMGDPPKGYSALDKMEKSHG